jgi:small subunit ribosomal protein S20
MANHKSAEKRARQTETRTERNRARRSRLRTFVKRLELAVESGDATAAESALKSAQPEIARGVSKGIMHRNTASRKLSRMTLKVNALLKGAAS